MILTLALLAQFFFGEYYGEPSGCGWACLEGECVTLPSCHPLLPPHIGGWPLIRLEPEPPFGFRAPKIGFDYIISGPFNLVITQFDIDWNVRVFIGLASNDQVIPASVTGTVPVTLWVKPQVQADMVRLGDNYSYTVHVPNEAALIGLTLYHQTVMWWFSPSGTLRVVGSRGVKATVEA